MVGQWQNSAPMEWRDVSGRLEGGVEGRSFLPLAGAAIGFVC